MDTENTPCSCCAGSRADLEKTIKPEKQTEKIEQSQQIKYKEKNDPPHGRGIFNGNRR